MNQPRMEEPVIAQHGMRPPPMARLMQPRQQADLDLCLVNLAFARLQSLSKWTSGLVASKN